MILFIGYAQRVEERFHPIVKIASGKNYVTGFTFPQKGNIRVCTRGL
jgi:hypothetical protein